MIDRDTRDKIIDWGVKITTPIVAACMVYVVTTLVTLDKRVTVIEANNYTQIDASDDREKIYRELTAIRESMNKIDRQMADTLTARMDLIREEFRMMRESMKGTE